MAQTPNDTLDAIFDSSNKALLDNDFQAASEGFDVLRGHGHHPAVHQNLALAQALGGHADVAMELLLENRDKAPTYLKSFVLAAELHRRAARGSSEGAGAQLLEEAADLLKKPLETDPGDTQTCIVASETLAGTHRLATEAVKWHVMALAAAKVRSSSLVSSFTRAFMDDLKDSSVHYFSSPPEAGITTGSVTLEARTVGRCIALVRREGHAPADSPLGPEWPVVHVTFGPGPARTDNGNAHVRTTFPWAARMAAAALVADVGQSVVFDPAATAWKQGTIGTQALLTVADATVPIGLCCMKPASEVEVKLLQELFRPGNVPPCSPTDAMAAATFNFLAADSQLDVEHVT